MMGLKVCEIFHSIQGESSYTGLPCTFVRLTGCNLRCIYCDTQYAYAGGDFLEIKTIMKEVKSFGCPLVEITGGEPLFQQETPELISDLLSTGYEVLLETNGSQDISWVDERCVRIVDIKCPSSGEESKNDLKNFERFTPDDELKFVIGSRQDYDFAKGILNQHTFSGKHIHFSPVFDTIEPKQLADWILKDRLNVRLQLQLHKIIWSPEARGV